MILAYLDPASGSMLAAAVVAGFAGAMVTIKVWWQRIKDKVRRRPAAGTPAVSAPAGSTAAGAPGERTAMAATPDQES